MHRNGNQEVLNYAPSREQLAAYPAQSKFNPNKYSKEQAENVLRNRAQNLDIEIYNDGLSGENKGINHFLGTDRLPYVRSVENTINNADINFTWDGKQHFAKKYTNGNSGNDFMDLVITKNGKAFNKFPSDEKFVANKIKGAQDLSLKAPTSDTFKPINGVSDTNNIPLQKAVVNSNLYSVDDVMSMLRTPNQRKYLQEYLTNAAKNMDDSHALGSLSHINKAKSMLGKDIEALKASNRTGDAEKMQQLINVKQTLDSILQSSGKVKNMDAKYALAMRLEDAFKAGQQFGKEKIGNLPNYATTAEKKAWTQGFVERAATSENPSDFILKNKKALEKVLPKKSVVDILREVGKNKMAHKNATDAERIAIRKLGGDSSNSATRSPIREATDSIYAPVGYTLDVATLNLLKRRNANHAEQILSGNIKPSWIQKFNNNAKKYMPDKLISSLKRANNVSQRYAPNDITPYLVQSLILSDND